MFRFVSAKNQSPTWRMLHRSTRNQILGDGITGKRRFPSFRKISTPSNRSLPSNMILRYCPSSTKLNKTIVDIDNTSQRPLLLLFAWMFSRNEHIEKYRQFWFDRGFDVLSVRTPPTAILFPSIGAQKIAENAFNLISNHRLLYDEIVVHAFSVGGYQFCEFLNILEQTTTNENHEKSRKQVYDSLKGVIIDSCVFPEDASQSLSLAITNYRIAQPILEKFIEKFFRLTKSSTIDRYIKVFNKLYENPRKIPGLVFYCKDDVMSNHFTNRRMHQGWKVNGIISDYICWDHSLHVQHFRVHHNEYQQKVDEFCSKLNLKKMILPKNKN